MNDMKDKVRTALNEARILVLGIEVLVGFDFEAVFQKNFVNLPDFSQGLKIVSLLLLLVALGLTMAPAAFHQIVERGEENPRCLSFVTTVVGIALLPFALGLGAEIYVAVQKVAGILPGIVVQQVAGSGMVALVCSGLMLLFFYGLWFGYSLLRRDVPSEQTQDEEHTRKLEVGS